MYPGGITAVPLATKYVLPMILNAGESITFTKEITGTVPFMLCAISSDQASTSLTGIRCQIQLPNGRYLFGGNGVDIGQFTWVGSWRWDQDPSLRCEPGSRIQVTLTDTTAGGTLPTTAVNLVFEGVNLHFMRGGVPVSPGPLVSTLPRYQGVLNENIMAPAWLSDEAIEAPGNPEYFNYSTPDPNDVPLIATWSVTSGAITVAPSPAPFEIQIDPGYVFDIRKMLFDVQVVSTSFPATLDGVVVVGKIRTGSGFVLNDSFIDLQRYLCGAASPARFSVKGGDSVFIDAELADIPAGASGTVTLQVFLRGFRRHI